MKILNRAGRVACVPFDGEGISLFLFGGADIELVSWLNSINFGGLTV